jgi:hypothetical protein
MGDVALSRTGRKRVRRIDTTRRRLFNPTGAKQGCYRGPAAAPANFTIQTRRLLFPLKGRSSTPASSNPTITTSLIPPRRTYSPSILHHGGRRAGTYTT